MAAGSLGSGGAIDASSGSGDIFGFLTSDILFVQTGYTSGDPLAGTMTLSGQTLTTIGLTPGTYEWTWGAGADADTMTLNITVPEPSSALMLGLSSLGLILRRRRQRGETHSSSIRK